MRFLLYMLSGAIMIMMVGLIAVFAVVSKYGSDLPDYRQLADYEPKIVTRVHAGDGRLLAEFSTEKRVFVPISAVPKRVIDAFLAAEDKDFYRHGGLDIRRIFLAAVGDLRNMHSDKRASGASTITQQVAKNMLLTPERTMSRKIKEAILAFRIEETFSKDRILELYLNQIYLGQGAYGVAAASLTYFDKPLDELTVAEAAMLGALPKAPNEFNPMRHARAAEQRRNWVIDRMQDDGFITADEQKDALATPLETKHQSATEFVQANYFTEDVRKQLQGMYGDEGLYGGGLSVRTTLDPKLQGIAVKSLRDGLVAYDQRHGWRGALAHIALGQGYDKRFARVDLPDGAGSWQKALVLETGRDALLQLPDGTRTSLSEPGFRWTHRSRAAELVQPGDVVLVEDAPVTEPEKPAKKGKHAKDDAAVAATPDAPRMHQVLHQMPAISGAMIAMDPHTGRVLAMVGGLSASANEFNRATQANRQPGSSFKPFVYMAALDKGFTPSTLVEDAPIALSQGPGLPLWRPVNYEHDFLGLQPLRVGVEKSRNAMTVRIAEYIGMPAIVDEAKRFGVMDNPAVNYSLAIGSGETTLMRMVTAYSEIVNGGRKIQPALIDRVQDRNGKTLYRHDARTCPACMNTDWKDDIMVPQPTGAVEQVETPQTAFQMTSIMEGVVQRGTAHELAKLDRPLAGKTGTTNESKDVWFIGFTPDLTVGVFVGFDQPKSLGKHETGASTSVPIFGEFMKEALADQPSIPFRIPPGIRMVKVNPSSGQPDFGNSAAIWEAFLPGNEPGGDNFVVNGATLAARLNSRGESDAETPDAGDMNGTATDAASSDDADSDMQNDDAHQPIAGVSGSAPAIETEQAPIPMPVDHHPAAQDEPGSASMGTGGLY